MSVKALRLLAIILAVGAGLLGYMGVQLTAEPQQTATAAVAPSKPEPVGEKTIIAKRPIAANHAIQVDDLAVIEVPVRNKDAYATADDLIGKAPRVSIGAGDVIQQSQFRTGSAIARMLPPGTRAMAIKVTEVVGSGGYVQPGDYVDVVFYLRKDNTEVKRSVSRTLLRQVQVLAYGKVLATTQDGHILNNSEETDQADAASRSVVLAVPRDSVEKLMLADNAGSIRLSVVPEREIEGGKQDENEGDRQVRIQDLTSVPHEVSRAYGVGVYRGTKRTTEYVTR
jgi:pilus assembly protein CpaB